MHHTIFANNSLHVHHGLQNDTSASFKALLKAVFCGHIEGLLTAIDGMRLSVGEHVPHIHTVVSGQWAFLDRLIKGLLDGSDVLVRHRSSHDF